MNPICCPLCGCSTIHADQHLNSVSDIGVCSLYDAGPEIYDETIREFVCDADKTHVFYVSVWPRPHEVN